MADCCTPGTGFPNSDTLDQLALNQSVVWEEICKLQQAILAAASQCQSGGGQFCTIVAGTSPMTFVSGVTGVTVINGGSGYFQDSPTIKFIPPVGSSASGATGTLTTNGGKVLSITVTNGGTGYAPISSTMSVTSSTGSNAQLKPLVDASGRIVSISILNSGSGYTLTDTVTATRALSSNPAYTNAVFRISTIGSSGEIIAVSILNSGSGYDDSVTTVKIVSTLNPTLDYPIGAGFQGTVLTNISGSITNVLINNGGVGYAVMPPILSISNPGSGAVTSVVLAGTSVSAINVISPGLNYVPTPTGTVFNPSTAGTPNPPSSGAVVSIQFATNTYGTDPTAYYQVFAGTLVSKQLAMQMNTVISYFTSLGYTITRQTNPATGITMQWKICW